MEPWNILGRTPLLFHGLGARSQEEIGASGRVQHGLGQVEDHRRSPGHAVG